VSNAVKQGATGATTNLTLNGASVDVGTHNVILGDGNGRVNLLPGDKILLITPRY